MTLKKLLSHLIFRPRYQTNSIIKQFAKGIQNKHILEIGTGAESISALKYFSYSNTFIQSDIWPGFNQIDVLDMKQFEVFDIIICANVLEHVYDYKKAIHNIHKALKPNGTLLLISPFGYPIHDSPFDFFRFSRYALLNMLVDFREVRIEEKGIKSFPVVYGVVAVK